ncbi:MAG: glucosamine-6-phosphate deaminase [Clostridiales bacterium]|nr:glucosamine-6-phosphate deaminase [Clostridiales bacterium]
MIVHVYENKDQASLAAASLFSACILSKPDAVLGLATGSTPIETYAQLIRLHDEGLLDFSHCTSFNLDEYVGLSPDHPCSYHRFMKEQLFDRINMKKTHVPRGDSKDLMAEARRYDDEIEAAGGIDIQFLGLGQNGHIGFNEPDSVFSFGTQIVNLTKSTIEANQRFFKDDEEVPTQAISLGAGGIMKARKIVLVALGEAKAEAVRAMMTGDLDPQVQASILRIHPDTVIILDQESASLL